MKIGFYDSGLGGLTVLKEVLNYLPNEDFLYYADTMNIPYGDKTQEEIVNFAKEAAIYLVEKGVECIIFACNTASSAAGQAIREEFSAVPIICMEPAINLAAKNNESHKRILMLSTALTLKLEKYNLLKEKLHPHNIDELAMPGLVKFAEEFRTDDAEVREYLKKSLNQFNLDDYSFIVLGCTHFTYFKDVIQDMFVNVNVIDGNTGVAKRLVNITKNLKKEESGGTIDIHFTGDVGNKINISSYLGRSI